MYYYSDVTGDDSDATFDDELELLDLALPPDLAAMIKSASADSFQLTAARNVDDPLLVDARYYYPTYTDGELCSTKLSTEFNNWETYYETLVECCDSAFSWDYDACMNIN